MTTIKKHIISADYVFVYFRGLMAEITSINKDINVKRYS